MNIRKSLKGKLIALHKWNQKRWLIVSLIMSTASIWFSLILTFCGQDLNLISVSGNKRTLTWPGSILTFIVILFSLVVVLAQRCYEYEELNNNKDKMGLQVLQTISTSTNEICDCKYATLLEQIYGIKNNKIKVPQIVSKPKEQLKQIIKCLNESLCKTLSYGDYKINSNEMYVCLHYNFPEESKEWYLAESVYAERSISTTELLNDNSTFKQILDFRQDLIFWNSKEDAKKHNKYIEDEEDQFDENHNLKGSIACYKIQIIFHSTTYINAIISFATYSKRFVNKKNKNAINTVKYNIKENILSVFKKRINIELCLLYLMKLNQIEQKGEIKKTNLSVAK
ncbi:hypothetical protein [Clostridium autoethanogenum]|uniref:Uncharacterized protein n=1 Tax=Clostridium autoethanogenum DSM 10061 TaxID=1341692 RepID=A0ABM5NU86_9CLOT|nr:hypothetical protein [Clostridium autoethanogenum]AGY75863.1 hypothetical protein CAETHG_1642 [Clostridium autoethanogenum DSM 10061]ALU36029.1 putative membrane protein [Clostridium autoethanogenum DSM 10061]OVY51913.1 hypothetical protein WX72_00790 [Clostridium autoethanogenum]